jgi:hypothetical protein
MKKKLRCIACEIADKDVIATEIVDKTPLCKIHAAIYKGKFENLTRNTGKVIDIL